jgi:MoaA/NifB/PqqE/SkfB family radical SAM enzyme
MTFDNLEYYFKLVRNFIQKHRDTLDDITIMMSGAEISLLSDTEFIAYGEKLYAFFKEIADENKEIIFHMATLSNMVDISLSKKEWLESIYVRSVTDGLDYSVFTSFEKHTNRFSKPTLLKKWENNILWFKERKIPMTAIWSISKEDAVDYKSIISYFESLDLVFRYVPILPTGEAKNNMEVIPTYEEFNQFLKNIYSYDYKKNLLSQDKFYSYDRVINIILEQNGFVMIDLLQDLTWQFEKYNNYNIDNKYIHDNNRFIFKISENEEESSNNLSNLWNTYLDNERKYYIKSGCFSCEYFSYCNGGIGTFRPVYNKKDECAGFKSFLISIGEPNDS